MDGGAMAYMRYSIYAVAHKNLIQLTETKMVSKNSQNGLKIPALA